VVSIVVMHAMYLSELWFYLRNIETDKQRQVKAFACACCALSAFLSVVFLFCCELSVLLSKRL
jgi:hypothetical protein